MMRPTMPWLRFPLFMAAFLVLLSGHCAFAVTVTLPPSGDVKGDLILLGDLAQIEGDTVLAGRLQELVIGKAPKPGRSLSLPGSRIRIRIQKMAPDAVVSVPDIIRVSRAGQSAPEGVLQDLLKGEMQKRFPASDIRIRSVRVMGNRQYPEGELTFSDFMLSGSVGSRVRGSVLVGHGGTPFGKLRFSARVDRMGVVVVAARELNRNERITRRDLRLSRQNLADLPASVFADPALAVGRCVTLKIPAGDALRQDRLANPPLVRRGDRIRLVARSGPLKVVTDGTAKEDGAKGEQIRVENLRSGKVITARVTGRRTATVLF